MSKDTSHTQPRVDGKFVSQKMTLEAAIKLAEYVIKGREDYIYDEKVADGISGKCRNWNRGLDRPSCVVGHILFEYGVSKEELLEHEFASTYVFRRHWLTNEAEEFLALLQHHQDSGKSWGESLELAKAKIETINHSK